MSCWEAPEKIFLVDYAVVGELAQNIATFVASKIEARVSVSVCPYK